MGGQFWKPPLITVGIFWNLSQPEKNLQATAESSLLPQDFLMIPFTAVMILGHSALSSSLWMKHSGCHSTCQFGVHSKSDYTRSYLWHSAAAERSSLFLGAGVGWMMWDSFSEARKFRMQNPPVEELQCTDEERESGCWVKKWILPSFSMGHPAGVHSTPMSWDLFWWWMWFIVWSLWLIPLSSGGQLVSISFQKAAIIIKFLSD
jgi:hypothetical protein